MSTEGTGVGGQGVCAVAQDAGSVFTAGFRAGRRGREARTGAAEARWSSSRAAGGRGRGRGWRRCSGATCRRRRRRCGTRWSTCRSTSAPGMRWPWCRMLRGDLDGAEASFRKVYELDRTFGETHGGLARSEEHTSELQSPYDLVCRLLLEKKKNIQRGGGDSERKNVRHGR